MFLSLSLSHTHTHTSALSVRFEGENHIIKVTAHGKNTSSMTQLVLDNICRTIIGNSNQIEKKKVKTRRGGRVNRVRRGSDGFVKNLQMDKQNLEDISSSKLTAERKKKTVSNEYKRLLKCIGNIRSMKQYDDIWNDDSSMNLANKNVTQKYLIHLLKIFDIPGRSDLKVNNKMK